MEGIVIFLIVAVVVIVALVIIAALLFGGLRTSLMFTVHTQERVIVERLGKFRNVATPGLNFKTPFIDNTTRAISLRVQQLEVNIESKTKDNVFVTVPVAVQFQIREDQVFNAYYKLSDPEAQIRSYVFDTVRSALSGLDLDEAFESKDDIARSVEYTLSERMAEFGFNIVNTLVQDISPDSRVRDSMNSINAAQRDRVAAQSLAEADKIKRVTQAEAEADSKRLQGEGVAAQRKAIAMGIAEQYEMLRKVGIEHSAEQLLLMTQYFDTMQDVARHGRSNVLYLPSNPGTVGSMGEEIRNAMLQSQEAQKADSDGSVREAGEDREAAAQERQEQAQERADQARHQAQDQAQQARRQARQQSSGGDDLPPWANPGNAG